VRLGLAAVFLIAAAFKLADRSRTTESMQRFGVPAAFAGPAAIVVPVVELAACALLLASATARTGAAVVVAMLVVFSAVLARAALRGETADCGCFGTLASARPAAALARNAALAAAAIAVVAAGAGRPLADLGATGAVGLVAGALIVALGWVAWRLLQQNTVLLRELHARETNEAEPVTLAIGSPAPEFALPTATGEIRTLYDLLAPGLPLAMVFSDPECEACAGLPGRLADLRRALAGELELALVTRGVTATGPFEPVLLQRGHEVTNAYGATHVPSAILIAPDGTIAGELAAGDLAVEELLARELLEAVS
jgi:uncharacterized membrane protein YphA (DoxX/SURF4 family)